MIYSPTPKYKRCNLSSLERAVMKKLKRAKQTQWMLDKPIK